MPLLWLLFGLVGVPGVELCRGESLRCTEGVGVEATDELRDVLLADWLPNERLWFDLFAFVAELLFDIR